MTLLRKTGSNKELFEYVFMTYHQSLYSESTVTPQIFECHLKSLTSGFFHSPKGLKLSNEGSSSYSGNQYKG